MPLRQLLFGLTSNHPVQKEPDGGVIRILKAARAHLGMDVAFASHVTNTHAIIQYCDAVEEAPFGAGAAFPVDEGYCKRILEGRIPPLINDTSTEEEVADLPCTKDIPIGSHISVPMILSDGRIYGTFCGFSFRPDHSLGQRDVQVMRVLAELAAADIEAELAFNGRQSRVVQQISELVERDKLTVVYQPIYSLAANHIVGVEALARFPDCGSRSPDQWFAEANEFGLGVELELIAARSALRGLQYLPQEIYLAINVSPDLIESGRLLPLLKDIAPGRVVLEVTEHALIRDLAHFQDCLTALRSQVRIAVDDAGAGYSGLQQILAVEPDIIKLDMSLTRGIDHDHARAALASALILFSQKIGAQIVAEGVETAAELQALRELGAHCAQGYHLQRPRTIASFAQFLIARRMI